MRENKTTHNQNIIIQIHNVQNNTNFTIKEKQDKIKDLMKRLKLNPNL